MRPRDISMSTPRVLCLFSKVSGTNLSFSGVWAGKKNRALNSEKVNFKPFHSSVKLESFFLQDSQIPMNQQRDDISLQDFETRSSHGFSLKPNRFSNRFSIFNPKYSCGSRRVAGFQDSGHRRTTKSTRY